MPVDACNGSTRETEAGSKVGMSQEEGPTDHTEQRKNWAKEQGNQKQGIYRSASVAQKQSIILPPHRLSHF